MFDCRARHQGAENSNHQKLFAECQREHGGPLKERPDARKLFGAKMNTATFSPCQTSGQQTRADRLRRLLLLTGLFLACPIGRAAPPEPSTWQRELDAVRLADATAAQVTAGKPAEGAATEKRLDELYRQLAAKYPDRAAVHKAAGDHFWRSGDTVSAVSEWQAAQALDPADAETASALGSAWLRDGQTGAAREQFQRAVDARPDAARSHFDLANVLFVFRRDFVGSPALPDEASVLHQALAHFRRASELAAGNGEFARAYAETFYGVPNPDWTEGFAAWEHVRSLNAASPDFATGHLARISLRLGKPEQAEAYLDSIHDPAFAPIKASLRRQAEEMKQKAATTPSVPR